MRCVRCYSYAINHAQHGRDGSDGDLCDVCYWRARAEYPAVAARVRDDSVRSIMLNVVPGPDGQGVEVYAKTAAARVPLTDEQIDAIIGRDPAIVRYPFVLARAIERAHGITAAGQEGGAA